MAIPIAKIIVSTHFMIDRLVWETDSSDSNIEPGDARSCLITLLIPKKTCSLKYEKIKIAAINSVVSATRCGLEELSAIRLA
ncbi:MAG: hypothetical protein HRT71_16315 [Flavobacteriales bacterium]|nr:hypothetical protein [Flavobacteriales bacterium]